VARLGAPFESGTGVGTLTGPLPEGTIVHAGPAHMGDTGRGLGATKGTDEGRWIPADPMVARDTATDMISDRATLVFYQGGSNANGMTPW